MSNLDLITRRFSRVRESGYVTTYPFTTYSVIWSVQAPARNNFERMCLYFQKLIIDGAPDPSGKRSISQSQPLYLEKQSMEHPLTELARQSGYMGKGIEQHAIVQEFLFKNDPTMFASEIPVWNDQFHGHIDILRYYPDDTFLLADFKPNANKETKADTQVWNYRECIYERTGIPKSAIQIGYFDHKHFFTVTL